MPALFRDRQQAGRLLASRLWRYAHRDDAVVLGLLRGGVPVAAEVAAALGLPLDVMAVRRLGVPGESERVIGAIAPGGITVLNEEVIREMGIEPEVTEAVAAREGEALARHELAHRGPRPDARIEGRIAILVDDGIATGTSARAAAVAARRLRPAKVIVAAPVASPQGRDAVAAVADAVVAVVEPEPFHSIGSWYDHFPQVTEEDVRDALAAAAARITAREVGPSA